MQSASPRAATPGELPARSLGHYELLHEIGRGGMATLHVARHMQLGTLVAIKRMLPAVTDGALLLRRFRNEAILAANVRHPNVVQVYDYGTWDGAPYLVMELLEGESLAAVLASGTPMPVQRAIDQFLYVLSGVLAVHAAGIVHRDLKPQNLFVRRRPGGHEDAVVLDFGVAKRTLDANVEDLASSSALTSSGATVGTPAYMAPEQILRAKDAGPPADQYALGVTLYQCLTGKQPFFGASPYEVMHAALHATIERPSRIRAEIPAELDAIVSRAMQRDASERFPSLHALGEALLPYASMSSSLAWRADVLRTRATVESGVASGETLSERPLDGVRGLSLKEPRPARLTALLWVATASLGVAAGATLSRRGSPPSERPATAERQTVPPEVSSPPPPAPSVAGSPVSVEPPPAMTSTVRVAPVRPRPQREFKAPRGTNGAPILE